MKILIVEDDMMVALTMAETLAEVGHVVIGLAREEDLAMRMVGHAQPDLALVDLELARGASGAIVVRKLREFGISAVFVSGSPVDCRRVGFQIGALGCLSKPFNPDELIDAVDVAAAIMRRQPPGRVPSNLALYYLT
jgi:two-component system, response regulator PdtaR